MRFGVESEGANQRGQRQGGSPAGTGATEQGKYCLLRWGGKFGREK